MSDAANRKEKSLLNRQNVAVAAAVMASVAAVERLMGRSLLGPDGRFGWWEGNILSSECSQRFADPYSLSHIVHGIVFYALLWSFARKSSPRTRLMMALALEAGWEILENSPFIIGRYREATIALGYVGDSVLNSLSDILMMAVGYTFAAKWKPWASAAAVLALELGCALWIRDNLLLNVVMLIHPFSAIKQWQIAR